MRILLSNVVRVLISILTKMHNKTMGIILVRVLLSHWNCPGKIPGFNTRKVTGAKGIQHKY